jgi:hypothetical protein
MPQDQGRSSRVERHVAASRSPPCAAGVRPLDRRHDAGPLHEALHHRRDAVAVPERPKGRDRAQEHVIARRSKGRPRGRRRSHRQHLAAAAVEPRSATCRRPAASLSPTRCRRGGVAPRRRPAARGARGAGGSRDPAGARRPRRTGCNQPVHLLRRQIPRHVGKPPMGVAGNDIVETCPAAAFDGKVAQERTQAGRQLLDRSARRNLLAQSRKKLRMAAGSHPRNRSRAPLRDARRRGRRV